jgi:hypothetical protein
MRRTTALVNALLLTLLSLTACSDDSGSTGSSGSGGKVTIDITVKDGEVTPHGDRVKAKVGQPVTLNIDADTSGEIHVHSSPEQEIEFDKGTSTKELTIDQPGIVDVEDHALEQVIVQLEVS